MDCYPLRLRLYINKHIKRNRCIIIHNIEESIISKQIKRVECIFIFNTLESKIINTSKALNVLLFMKPLSLEFEMHHKK